METPGGIPETNQSLKDTARAELLQETGYVAEELIVYPPILFDGTINAYFIPCIAFACEKIRDQQLEQNEIIEVELVPIEDWYQRLLAVKILTDSKYFALSMLALPHAKKHFSFSL